MFQNGCGKIKMNSKLRHFCITATCIWPNWIFIKHAYNLHKVFLFPVGLESRLCSVTVFSVRYVAYPLRDGSLFMQRGGGRGGKQEGRSPGYFRLPRVGGLNSFIKKFRGDQQFDRKLYFPNSQIFILLLVPVMYLTFVTELFTITFFSWWQFFDYSLTVQDGPVYLKDWKGRLDICQSGHYCHQTTCISASSPLSLSCSLFPTSCHAPWLNKS